MSDPLDGVIDRTAAGLGIDPDALSESSRSALRHGLDTLLEAKQKLPDEEYRSLVDWWMTEFAQLGQAYAKRQRCIDCGEGVRRWGSYRCQACFDKATADA